MAPPLPARIGRYLIEGELGRGMMGVVYQARDPELGRTVALKTVSLAFAVSDADREDFNTRFLEEARIAARLSHPGIVVVHEVGRDAESATLYIALEHLHGRTLADLAGGGRPLPWRDASRMAAGVARALQHAHAHGIVHRDIKPANIIVLDTGEAKVLDFGVAKAPASQLTGTGQLFGTPAYMSPEQVGGQALDGRSDVFSLGCVLYLALTGRRPFDGESVPVILSRVLHATPEPPSRLTPGVPAELDRIVARATAKDPAARYSDASALADDLDALLADEAPRAPAPPAPAPLAASRRRSALVTLGAAVLIMGGWLARPRPTASPADPAATGAGEPARLAIDFDHHLKSGVLEVWVDDQLVLEEAIEGRVTQKVLSFRLRKGSVQETLEVAPGPHDIAVHVTWDGRRRSSRIAGVFKPGATRRLEISVARLTRDLTLDWR